MRHDQEHKSSGVSAATVDETARFNRVDRQDTTLVRALWLLRSRLSATPMSHPA